jgi:hypothetical protein
MCNGMVHICSFTVLDDVPKSRRTYPVVKDLVLKAGRFSVFEATESPAMARIFDRLVRDPEIETLHDEAGFGFPWTGVRRRDKQAVAKAREAGCADAIRTCADGERRETLSEVRQFDPPQPGEDQ